VSFVYLRGVQHSVTVYAKQSRESEPEVLIVQGQQLPKRLR